MTRRWLGASLAVAAVCVVGAYVASDPEREQLDTAARGRLGGTYVRLSGGVTHYRVDGPADGPGVVLVHGGTIPIWTWDEQVPALTRAGYRVLTYDQYGRGLSDRPDVTYDQALYSAQLAELVDTLGLTDPFDLVGLSLGGGTVVNYTAAHPERVRRLVLISPVVRDYHVSALFRTPWVGDAIARAAGTRILTGRFRRLYAGNPDLERYTEAFKAQTRVRGFRRSVLSMVRGDALRDYTDAYRAVGAQARDVLLIWGTADDEITDDMVGEIRTLVPGLEFRPVEGAGHGIVAQRPDVVNRLLIDFLR